MAGKGAIGAECHHRRTARPPRQTLHEKGQAQPAERYPPRVREDFDAKMADELTADQLTDYTEKKLSEGYAPATVDRTIQLFSGRRISSLHGKHGAPASNQRAES